MLKHGSVYTDAGQDYYERQYQERVMRNLRQRAKAFGFELVPAAGEPALLRALSAERLGTGD